MNNLAPSLTTSLSEATASAEALTRLLPTTVALSPVLSSAADAPLALQRSSVVASYVGEFSADVALALVEPDSLVSAASPTGAAVALADILRPSFEAATGILGTGVLGDTRADDASALFADAATVVFALSNAGVVAGWYAIRIRTSNVVAGGRPLGNDEIVGKLGRINNVEMSLTVEIGRTRISVRDVLGLEPGAVIELDRSAGAPADVLLNGRLIAHGEIVVIDQDYAVRITKILDVIESLS
ncbi:flagellar motor switch protein FliN/FliY [Conyzicola lurida]|uniref:Flagellar motor switch protein FliN/FliY n=1 Tax=Conyzicola lurida TaxID=1172621 RepID=A0A841ATQ7_9MICO|nr:flagellar motor switch protein FliN/FliY [Conyzicola lurida]